MTSDAPPAADADLQHRLTLVLAGAALLIASGLTGWLRPVQRELAAFAAMAGAIIVALPIMTDAVKSIRARGFAATKFYMDQYITLAVLACLAAGQYVTGGIVAIILVVGQVLEERSVLGMREALDKLGQYSKTRARRWRDGVEEEVDAADLRAGDRVRVRPGDTIPADGRVLTGASTVNQSSITGESLPADVEPGSDVFAGTSNLTGAFEFEVKEAGDRTVLGRVRHIIEEATGTEAPIMRLAEEYARYYTPLVLIIAAFVLFFTRDLNRAISVIIVSIPCAFVLASPSAMVAALATASRLGILVKSARFFEVASEIDTVVFDKTGTLTEGRLELARIEPLAGQSESEVLALAAALEQHSSHPVARAIHAAASAAGVAIAEPTDLHEQPGRGVTAKVGERVVVVGRASWLASHGITVAESDDTLSVLHLAVDGAHVARFHLRDRVRPEAAAALSALRAGGIERCVMLTGDRSSVARSVAALVGVDDVRAECLPEQKLEAVNALKAQDRRVMVVGDGVNDAPALAAGDLGVAMGAFGSDIAIQTADVALMNNDLHRLPALLLLARRTVAIINQNMLCGFLFILIAIVVSSLGWVSPIAAAFIHEFSAFFVIFNSARLLRFEPESTRAS